MNPTISAASSTPHAGVRAGSSLSALAALFRDNPVLGKDAGILGRRKRTAVAWVLAAFGLLGVALVAGLADAAEPRTWGGYRVVGPQMMLTIFGLSFGALSVLLTSLASTAITVERERGTLPLLLVSGLSPARIVAGKLGGLLAVTLPFLAITFPLLALSSFFLGVDLDVAVVAVAGLVVHAVAVAAAGLWASATTTRVRNALVLGFVAAGVPTLAGGLTIFGSLVLVLEDHAERAWLLGVAGVVVDVVIAAAFSIGAWSAMAPSSTPRWRVAKRLLLAIFVGVPAVALVGIVFAGEREELRAMLTVLVTCVAGLTCLIGPALTGVADTPTPARLSLGLFVVGAAVSVGTALVALTLQNPSFAIDVDDDGRIAAFIATCFAGCGFVALCARHIKNPIAPVVITIGFFVGLAVLPALFDPFTVGEPPLSFLSLPYVFDRAGDTAVACIAFNVLLGGLAFVFARGPRAGIVRRA